MREWYQTGTVVPTYFALHTTNDDPAARGTYYPREMLSAPVRISAEISGGLESDCSTTQ
jgi:hypothetical protein